MSNKRSTSSVKMINFLIHMAQSQNKHFNAQLHNKFELLSEPKKN